MSSARAEPDAPAAESSNSRAGVPIYAVAIVVLAGAIWLFAGVAYGVQIGLCFPSCGASALPPGSNTTGYPPSALRFLAWDDLYSDLYIATIGLLALFIGILPFRWGEPWAWYAILALVGAGTLTGLFDYWSWGGWFTFLAFGLPALVGLVLSAKSFFPTRSGS
jgi:hypothetical protein